MKKIVLCFFAILLPFILLGKDESIFGKFGIREESNLNNYNNYVGKTFRYLPSSPEGEIEQAIHFYGNKGEDYILTDFKISSGVSNLQFVFCSVKEPKTKVRIKIRDSWVKYLPLLDMDAFEEEKGKYIGKSFSHPQVKPTHKIVDVILKEIRVGSSTTQIVPAYIFDNGIECTSLDNIESKLFSDDLSGTYCSTLVKVEKPEDSADRYSDVKIFDEEGVTKFSFEDDLLSIIIFGDTKQFYFLLTNKSQNTIKIIWDDAVFVDVNGITSKIIHVGTKYSEKDALQPASTIIRGASIEDIACPTANIRYSEVLKEWVIDSMYPKTPSEGVKQVRLMLPIQIKDVLNEYVFVFDVKYLYNHPELLNYE